jgi:diaminohydroxyphosphoribosylaminopyrimidine deaminase/5-amino-6-(5-phosphoribosylamino)uracil reductase
MNPKSQEKIAFMQRAIDLADRGRGFVNPNPLVGAVIVKDGKIIGEGYHMCFGEAHAEVNAFLNATEDVEGADMYVTLEPCSHYGKTPPCALKIIEKKIKRVFVSQLDPNPLVSGRGIKLLEDAGIKVETGILEDASKKQNEVFLKYIQEKKPFVVMKYAMTLDGKIATSTKDSKWITNEKSRHFVHELRNNYMAIMVGANTVILDDPMLDTRLEGIKTRHPIRIVIDPDLSVPLNRKVIQTANTQPTWLVTSDQRTLNELQPYLDLGVKIIEKKTDPLDLEDLMTTLGEHKIDGLLIEGGSYLHGSFLDANIVDKAYVFIAPKMIGGQKALTPVGAQGVLKMKDAHQLTNINYRLFDEDIMIEGYFKQKQGEDKNDISKRK